MIGSDPDRRAQLPAQRESAVHLVAQADIEEDQVGKPRAQRRQRLRAVAVRDDLVALLAQHVRVVGADGGVVLDYGYALSHARTA